MFTMTMLYYILTGVALGTLVFVISLSIKTPHERTIQVITRFGKFHTAIMAVEGQRLNNPRRRDFDDECEPWEIIPIEQNYIQSLSERWNVYFFLWPFFRTHTYTLSYTKLKKKGDVAPGDVVIWSDEKTGESVVVRTNVSDHIEFQSEYPTITGNLFTKEMAKVLVFTNNTLRVTNPFKMMFRINNWLGVTTETIGGALKGIVGELTIQQLNQVKSESEEPSSWDFTKKMTWINKGVDGVPDGIEELWGVKLTKSVFKAFTPADANAETLMSSFLKPKIAQQEGEAAVIKANLEGDARVATETKGAQAYALKQAAIVAWKKKFLVDTGLAKVDADGNITELVPDANTRVGAEAVKELAKLTGTLVLGGDLNTMLNIRKEGQPKEEQS